MNKPRLFIEIVGDLFRYLETDYGFQKTAASEDKLQVDYKCVQKGIGIRIEWSHRAQYLFMSIYRLVNGEMVEDELPITGKSVINSIEFTDALKQSDRMLPAYEYDENCSYFDEQNGMKNYVAEFAARLRKHGKDFLKGDFHRFPKIISTIKRRAREYGGEE